MMTRRDRIREKIMARVRIDEVTGCWIWTGPTSGTKGRGAGYPRMSLGGQTVAVHIVIWTNEHGYIPGKKELDHVCRNRLCIRYDSEDHLQLVTRKRNILRQWEARKAASQIGHNGGPPMVCEEA
ncbi:HNH endonuclease signature motif containing protein [Rhizobium leguminosarum]|uniref:HNH endonuclease signature motif containing protein n=1 Tax=Rhizobium leguminosarum TaxID=384 RepID=UPI00160D5E86|nr:HNH endonuclease signature motif containing protein [Rhizobium leguminosarum]